MSRFEEQPGLEMVNIPSGLEPSVPHHDVLLREPWMIQTVVTDHDATGAGEKILKDEIQAHNRTTSTQHRQRHVLWLVIVVVATLVIVGAVVGGVVRSKASKSKNGTTPKTNSSILRQNSPLAVTGWQSGDKTNTQLFWQGKDNAIYYSAWDSGYNSWAAPVKTDVSAVPGSKMAAGVISQSPSQDGGPRIPQVQFYYQNSSGFLHGENFQSSFPYGLPDSINNVSSSFKMEDRATIATYWPMIIYEAAGLKAVWYGYKYGYTNYPDSLISSATSISSPIAVLPLQRLRPSTNETSGSDLKLLYHRSDGLLYEYNRCSNGTVAKSERMKGFNVSATGTIAAFTIAQNSSPSLLNTYIIYQAYNGTIMYGTNKNASGWDWPRTDTVFDDKDVATSLACITMATNTDPDIPLTLAIDQNKCYFQRRGELVEVLYDGIQWMTLGRVPIIMP